MIATSKIIKFPIHSETYWMEMKKIATADFKYMFGLPMTEEELSIASSLNELRELPSDEIKQITYAYNNKMKEIGRPTEYGNCMRDYVIKKRKTKIRESKLIRDGEGGSVICFPNVLSASIG